MYKIVLSFFIFGVSLIASDIDIKTFGTIGTTYNDNGNYIHRKNALQKNGSSDDLYFGTDSLLGIQGIYKINHNFTTSIQAVAQKDYNNEIKVTVDSGYLRYENDNNFIVKLGRMRTPYYRNSDNQNIGYSKLLVREPIEVYGQVPFEGYDGIELLYTNLLGDYFYNIQVSYGEETFIAPIHSQNEEVEITLDNLYSANLTFGTSEVEIRATYMHAQISAKNTMIDTIMSTLPDSLAKQYELKNKSSYYLGFGIFVDYNNFIFNSEIGKRKVPSFYPDLKAIYATAGYKIKNYTPYISFAKAKMLQETQINTATALDSFMAIQNLAQSTKSVGVKYFINKNTDLKFQYDHIEPDGEYGGFYVGSQYPQDMNVYTLMLDFVF